MLNDSAITRVVCIFDPDLAMDAKSIAEYMGDRDPAQIVAKPGGHPVTFHVRRLNHDAMGYVRAAGEDAEEQRKRAFKCAVVRVDNFRERHTRAMLMPFWEPRRVQDASILASVELSTNAELEAFEWAEIQEIGGVALHLSFFPRWTKAKCPLLLSSEQTWMAVTVSLAAQESDSAADGTSEPPSENP